MARELGKVAALGKCLPARSSGHSVTELNPMDPAWALAQPRLSASLGEGSFLLGFKQLNNETETETDAAQALFGDQRMEKWELSSQINFSPTW